MKKIPERVKSMLDSEDIEMVQLGANLMKEYVPKNKWERVLEMFSFSSPNTGNDQDIYIKKFTWKIEGDDIKIYDAWNVGWSWTVPVHYKNSIKYIVDDTQQNRQNTSPKSKGYVGKPRPRNGKARRSGPPRIRKK